MSTPGSNESGLLCSAEWHLRDHTYACTIYNFAMHITDGGKREFYVSQPRLAKYFGWDPKTVRAACKVLVRQGFFELLRKGTGGAGRENFANVYTVFTHSQLAAARPDLCLPLPSTGTLCSDNPKQVPTTGTLFFDNPSAHKKQVPANGPEQVPANGTLFSDHAPNKILPSLASRAPDLSSSASPQKVKRKPQIELPETFRPDIVSEQFAKRHNLDLEEELAAFSDLHLSIGNKRSNWQAVFYRHLVNAAGGR
jgi:hypothetical protein